MFTNESLAPCTMGIIAVTSIYSVIGFRDRAFRERNLFSVPEILAGKQYHRVFTSALLHADWNHLLLNMVSLYLFGRVIELTIGFKQFLLIYLAAELGGSALSLWIHRHHEYRAYGASGAVCGLIFSYIILFPGGSIVMLPLPVSVPAWLYAILFLIGSVLALKRQADDIGHDAHLGGAIIGLWTTACLEPEMVRLHLKLFLVVSGLAVLFFVYLVKNPLLLPLNHYLPTWFVPGPRHAKPPQTSDETGELDAILEKISRSGIGSLTRQEKARLDSASENYRRQSASTETKSKPTH